MDIFAKLTEARSEIEFFVVLSTLLKPQLIARVRPRMTSEYENGEVGLRLALEQTLSYSDGKHERLRSEITHTFTLYETGKLTWSMKGQPTLVGLQNIQAALKKFQDSLTNQQLPSQV